jgi:predicted TIM-barrel fold metal-dependent hydrolase
VHDQGNQEEKMKIDIFPHIIPLKYKEALHKITASDKSPPGHREVDKIEALPSLFDLDVRFRIMDKYGDLLQVLTLGAPGVEDIAGPKEAAELARIANDGMAELVRKYPDKFVAAVASLPMNDVDAALKELERAITELGFKGIQIFSDIKGKPLDSPEFMPLFERMAYHNLPILIHPETKAANEVSDYPNETESKYLTHVNFRWPYRTTLAMTRIALSGVFEKYPTIKIITHHCGAMVPFFAERIRVSFLTFEKFGMKLKFPHHLTKRPIDYYRMFYVDTATNGSTPALMCGYAFFGADHMLFGTDMPYDAQLGDIFIRQGILSIENMDIPDSEKKKIFEENAKDLFRLPI